MLCYDGVFGKCFEAEESDVRETVKQLNSKLKQNGYLFLGEYFDEMKKLNSDIGLGKPSSMVLNRLRFKEQENDTFVLRFGMLKDLPVLIVQANYNF